MRKVNVEFSRHIDWSKMENTLFTGRLDGKNTTEACFSKKWPGNTHWTILFLLVQHFRRHKCCRKPAFLVKVNFDYEVLWRLAMKNLTNDKRTKPVECKFKLVNFLPCEDLLNS